VPSLAATARGCEPAALASAKAPKALLDLRERLLAKAA
jgi:hypothetical protein